MRQIAVFCILLGCLVPAHAFAQQGPGRPGRPGFGGPGGPGGPPPRGERGGPGRADGKWWLDPVWAQRLNLTSDQQKRMEDVFQQNRVRLIELRSNLEKQEAILEPLIDAEHPQESAVLAQIDRVADARADLEKANARMLWNFRQVLTPEQWRVFQNPERR